MIISLIGELMGFIDFFYFVVAREIKRKFEISRYFLLESYFLCLVD